MNIIITGASQGIGRELGILFSQHPDNKLLLIARDATKLELLRTECKSEGVSILPMDICSDGMPKRLSFWVEENWGSVDILINNAGSLVNKAFNQISTEDFQRVVDTNYRAPFFVIQALYPYILKGRVKHIVNIGSMGGVQGSAKFPGLSIYSSSKMALAGLTECLATEFAADGVSVNCLALGSVQTEMLEAAFPGYTADSSPGDMAQFIMEWALGAGRLVSGKQIPVAKVGV